MRRLNSAEDVDRVFEGGRAIIVKHSTQCPISRFVNREVSVFMTERPEVPVYMVDVLENPAVSRYLAEKTGVRHESPQAFIIDAGSVKWHQSHYSVDAEALKKQMS